MKTSPFPHINLLRFVAALLIVVHHIEQTLADFSLPNHWSNPIVHNLGHIGVTFFFVLSGFLVANSLLQKEHISLSHSYRRRALRILPLYLFIIILSIGCLQFIPYFQHGSYHLTLTESLLYILLLPNVAITLFPPNVFLAHTWFIGSLEQVHTLLPPLFKNAKRPLLALSICILVYWALGILFKLLPTCTTLYELWHYINVDSIFIGALMAVVYHQHPRLKKAFLSSITFYTALVLCIALVLSGWTIPLFYTQTLAILFSIIILHVATARKVSLFDNRLTTLLGNSTYALFLIHPIIILALLPLLQHAAAPIIYLATLSASLLASIILHYAIERPLSSLYR